MVRLDSQQLTTEIARLTAQQRRRERRLVEDFPSPGDPTLVQVAGRRLRNFCNNDYLGLSAHPALLEAAMRGMRRFGFGAGASHLISGHSFEHHALEEELAAFTGRERALLFSSGYLANLGVISALAGRHDVIIADRLCHASLLDGALLGRARLRRYAHVDVAQVARLLDAQRAAAGVCAQQDGPAAPSSAVSGAAPGAAASGSALIITDGVFSMDGDVAPVAALAALAAQRGAGVLVDDAHGLGVLGERGRGTLELAGLDARAVPVLIGTLGKAFGTFGAFVAGEAALIEYLLQQTRTYIYTTALPPAVASATRAALKLADTESWRRERLRRLVQRWRSAAEALGLPLSHSSTPIQPLIVGPEQLTVALSQALSEQGFWVAPIRPPTVPAGSARLRITLSAAHRDSDVDALAETLARLCRQRGLA